MFIIEVISVFCGGLGNTPRGGFPRGTSELIKHQTLQRGFEAQRYFVLLTLKHCNGKECGTRAAFNEFIQKPNSTI